jgi:energy-coupling factor transporter transmembrane protein EcfT
MTILAGFVILVCRGPLSLASMSLAMVALLFLAKGPPLGSLLGLWPTFPFLLAIGGGHFLTGDPILGLLVIWQFALLLILSGLFTFTTSPRQIAAALEAILGPLPLRRLSLSPRDLSLMVILALRFFPLFFEEWERMRKAQRARGFRPRRTGLLRGARVLMGFSMALLSGMSRRAVEVTKALLARGYRPGRGAIAQPAALTRSSRE